MSGVVTRTRSPRWAPPGRRAWRLGTVSTAFRPRSVLAILALTAIALGVFVVGLGIGDYTISPADVVGVLAGGGEEMQRTVVLDWRFGRSILALLVGAALGMSGALTQSVARNPLVSPDVLGITHGASLAAVALIVAAGTRGSLSGGLADLGTPVVAFIGALITAGAVWLLAWRGGVDPFRLVLTGIGVAALLGGVVTWLMVRADLDSAAAAKVWLIGSLNGRDVDQVWGPMAAVLLGVLLAGWLTFRLSALALGSATALALGVAVGRTQAVQLLIAVVLAATAVSAAGPIGFVAFVAPQVAQRLAGTATPPLVAASLAGAALVAAADLLARAALPWELPVGIVTAVIGAPVLIHLVLRANRGTAT